MKLFKSFDTNYDGNCRFANAKFQNYKFTKYEFLFNTNFLTFIFRTDYY